MEQAGLDIHGKVAEVDVRSDYESYATFEIEFHNSLSMFILLYSSVSLRCLS